MSVREHSQTLVTGGDAKRVLRIFNPCKGGLEKITTNFPVKIEFTCVISMELTRNFHGKKRGPEFFEA